jgi:hypothetical protein
MNTNESELIIPKQCKSLPLAVKDFIENVATYNGNLIKHCELLIDVCKKLTPYGKLLYKKLNGCVLGDTLSDTIKELKEIILDLKGTRKNIDKMIKNPKTYWDYVKKFGDDDDPFAIYSETEQYDDFVDYHERIMSFFNYMVKERILNDTSKIEIKYPQKPEYFKKYTKNS